MIHIKSSGVLVVEDPDCIRRQIGQLEEHRRMVEEDLDMLWRELRKIVAEGEARDAEYRGADRD